MKGVFKGSEGLTSEVTREQDFNTICQESDIIRSVG